MRAVISVFVLTFSANAAAGMPLDLWARLDGVQRSLWTVGFTTGIGMIDSSARGFCAINLTPGQTLPLIEKALPDTVARLTKERGADAARLLAVPAAAGNVVFDLCPKE